jgi:hypothetical protein
MSAGSHVNSLAETDYVQDWEKYRIRAYDSGLYN